MEEKDLQKQINDGVQTDLDNHRQDIKELFKHANIANEEMGAIKSDVGIIKNDLKWVKDTFGKFERSLEKMDTRSWIILSSVILGVVAQILITLMKS